MFIINFSTFVIIILLSTIYFCSAQPHQNWNLKEVHLKLELNAKKVEKGTKIEGRSGQIPDQIRRHQTLALARRAKTLCETGFNAGHSAASFLKNSNPDAVYYGFDAGRMFHRYPEKNAKLLNKLVGKAPNGNDRVHVTFGDSRRTLPTFVKLKRSSVLCELVHVDGGHFGDVPKAEHSINKIVDLELLF